MLVIVLMVEACIRLRIGPQIPVESLFHRRMLPIALDTQEFAQNVMHKVFGKCIQCLVVFFIHLVYPEIAHQSSQRTVWRGMVVDMIKIVAAWDASRDVAESHNLVNDHIGSDKILQPVCKQVHSDELLESEICFVDTIGFTGRLYVIRVMFESFLSEVDTAHVFVEHLWIFIFKINRFLQIPCEPFGLSRSTEELRSLGEYAGV